MIYNLPKSLLFVVISIVVSTTPSRRAAAQAGPVYTMAGGGIDSAEGVPAITAYVQPGSGLGVDGSGNFYYTDGRNIVRRVDAGTGLVYTVAGRSGFPGHAGDGGPATAAILSITGGIHVTASGDIYIADYSYIRKVDGHTGIITTVAGGGGLTADGVPATDAQFIANTVYVDIAGNIYFSTNNKIRKVSAVTHLISTVAGNGSGVETGDGGPATDAGIHGTSNNICMDNAGNMYIVSGAGQSVRKIDGGSGIISTVVGGGSSSTAEGIPATDVSISSLHSCGVDGAGNLFIADETHYLVRRIDAATGLINTIAGTMGTGSSAEGTPALSAIIRPHCILVSPASGNIYYSDNATKIKKFSYSGLVPLLGGGGTGAYMSDSMALYIDKQCGGPQFTLRTKSYHVGVTVRSYFGDGYADTSIINDSWSGLGGYLRFNHFYYSNGTYTIKQVLCYSGIPVDSLSYSYHHIFCTNLSVRFYYDADLNCVKNTTEPLLIKQVVTEVDSNGIPVDTLKATSGFNYTAYGYPGDVFRFRILSIPPALYPTCPSTGILFDTLHAGVYSAATHFMAMSCGGGRLCRYRGKSIHSCHRT